MAKGDRRREPAALGALDVGEGSPDQSITGPKNLEKEALQHTHEAPPVLGLLFPLFREAPLELLANFRDAGVRVGADRTETLEHWTPRIASPAAFSSLIAFG